MMKFSYDYDVCFVARRALVFFIHRCAPTLLVGDDSSFMTEHDYRACAAQHNTMELQQTWKDMMNEVLGKKGAGGFTDDNPDAGNCGKKGDCQQYHNLVRTWSEIVSIAIVQWVRQHHKPISTSSTTRPPTHNDQPVIGECEFLSVWSVTTRQAAQLNTSFFLLAHELYSPYRITVLGLDSVDTCVDSDAVLEPDRLIGKRFRLRTVSAPLPNDVDGDILDFNLLPAWLHAMYQSWDIISHSIVGSDSHSVKQSQSTLPDVDSCATRRDAT